MLYICKDLIFMYCDKLYTITLAVSMILKSPRARDSLTKYIIIYLEEFIAYVSILY